MNSLGSAYFFNFSGKTRHLCVRDIGQSSEGMMWLAAEDGLYSFDGNHLSRHPFMDGGKERRGLGCYTKVTVKGDSIIVQCQKALLSFHLADYSFRLLKMKKADVQPSTCVLNDGSTTWIGSLCS